MNKRLKQQVSQLRDAFRVEALESRILLSADPIIGMVQLILPDDGSHDHVALDAYQAAPAGAPGPATAFGATDLHLSGLALLAENGGVLTVAPADNASAITLGDTSGAVTGVQLSHADLAQLQDGYSEIVIGSREGNHLIQIGDAGAGKAVTLNDTLHLINPQLGGEIFINTELFLNNGSSLVIEGSGHTTTFSANTTSTDDILINDSVRFNGVGIALTAGSDGSGNMQLAYGLGQIFQGDLDAAIDSAILRAPGNITIGGQVGGASTATGALSGLTIEGVDVLGVINTPDDVTFSETVNIAGDFTINASGVVTFAKTVTLTAGGDFTIRGATQVIFLGGVTLAGGGDLFIEADEITFSGGGESVVGTGSMTLRPTTVGLAIEVGSPPNGQTASTLNIDNSEIATFADGFSKIVIGHQTGAHASAGAGAVRIGAIGTVEQPTLRENLEVYGGSITVEDYSSPTLNYTLLVNGTIKFDAVGDITLYNQVEARNGFLQHITLYSASGAISQVNAGADGVNSEVLRGASLDVQAALGIGLFFTELGTVSATNTGASGAITISETVAGGDLTVLSGSQSDAGGNGNIAFYTRAGTLTVAASGSGVSAGGSGAVTLQTLGTGHALLVNDMVSANGGAVSLSGSGSVTLLDDATNDGVVTNNGGDITLVAGQTGVLIGGDISAAGGRVYVSATSAITMVDGKKVSSLNAGDSGVVDMMAGTGITLSIIEADGSVDLRALNGAIVDGLSGTAPNIDGDTAAVALSATTGIGAAGLALHTRVGTLSAANTVSGGLYVQEATALRLAGAGAYALDLAGSSGNASIVTTNGALTVAGALRSTGATGQILLQSGESGEATAASVSVQANISSASGSISILAADSIEIDNQGTGAPRIETLATGRTLDLQAADAVGMEGLAQLATNNGNVRIQAVGGGVTLGSVNAGTSASGGTISISAAGAIVDALDDDLATPAVNLAAHGLRLQAGAAIGSATAALETQVAVMAVQAGASAYLAEADAIAVGAVGPVTVNRVDAAGTTSPVTDLLLAGFATAAGGANIVSSGDLAIDSAINAGSGNLRVAAGGALSLNAAIGNGSGSISVLASGAITQTALGRLVTSAGTIDVVSAAAIVMADGALAQTDAGNIRYQAASDITLGLLDARTGANRSDGLLTGQGSWGSVSIVAGGAVLDLAADSAADVYANDLRLQAAGVIGSGSEALEIEAQRLSAAAAGLFVSDVRSIYVGQTGAISVNRVLADGSVAGSSVADAAQAGLASSGALVLQALSGIIEIGSDGPVDATGNILLAASSYITLAGNVASAAASLSVRAGADVYQYSALSAGATVDLKAAGQILQVNGSSIATSGGNVALEAGTFVTLESIAAGSGAVRIVAGNSIIEGDGAADGEVDISAAALQMTAGGSIGDAGDAFETSVALISTSSGAGNTYLSETDSVSVGSVTVQVNRVAASGIAAATVNAAQAGLASTGGGDLVLVLASGDLSTSASTSTAGGGILLRAAAGSVTLGASVSAVSGSLSVLASGTITQNAAINGTSTIDIEAGGAIGMADGALTTGAGNVRYAAGTTLGVGSIVSGGIVSLNAASIVDSGSSDTDITSYSLRMVATDAIGSSAAHLQIATGFLGARAGSGGMYLNEANGLQIGSVGAVSVSRLPVDGLASVVTDTAQATTVSDGNLVIISADTTVVTSSVSAAGNLLLQANGASTDLHLIAAVTAGGNASMSAGRDLFVSGAVQATTAGKSVDLVAARSAYLSQGSSVTTNAGNIVLDAGVNAAFELLDAGSASVSVRAGTGSIADSDAAGDSEADILAGGVLLRAGASIGSASNHIETTAATLTANAVAGSMYVTETNALLVDTLTVQANRVNTTGSAVATAYAAQANLQAGSAMVLVSNAGSLTISDTVSAGGNLLLQSSTGGMIINSAISANGAALSLASSGPLAQHANISATGGGTIDIASTGTIAMDNGTRISGTGNIRVAAGTVMTLGAVSTSANVSLSASAITDAGNVETDVAAAQLRLLTTSVGNTGAGLAGSHLQLAVGTLAVSSAGTGGVYLDEADNIVIGSVADIGVVRVNANGTTVGVVDGAMSDLVSAGNVVLVTSTGSITVAEGDADDTGVSAGANLLLQAGGAHDIVLNAQTRSNAGNITLNAGRDIVQSAAIVSALAGKSIDLMAGGAIAMAQGSTTTANGGNISLQAGTSVIIETVSAGSGGVRVIAGDIVDGDSTGDSEVDIVAASLQLAANSIGSGSNALETSVGTISAQAGSGGMYLRETDALTVDSVTIQVNRVDGRGASATTANAQQANLAATGNVVLSAGALTISDLVASSAGSVLLESGADISIDSAISAAAGSVSVLAAGAIAQQADITTGASIDLAAGTAIGMAAGSHSRAGGNIRYAAAGVLEAGSIAGLDVSLTAATIIEGATADGGVVARELRLQSSTGTGTSAAPLTVTAGTLAAQVGSLHLNVIGDTTIGSVAAVTVNRLAADGSAHQVNDAGTSGITAAGGVTIAASGGIAQTAQISASTAGAAIALTAASSIVMAPAAVTSTSAGTIAYSAGGQLNLGLLDARSAADRASATTAGQAAWGSVVLNAGAGIADSGSVAVMAGALSLDAADIGSAANAFDIEAGTLLAADAASIYLAEASALAISGSGLAAGGTAALSIGGDLAIGAAITAAGLDIVAAGQLDMAAGASIGTSNGPVSLQAQSMTVGQIDAGSANVSLTAAGSIMDNAAPGAHIRAAGLRMTAGDAIGSAGNAFDTAVSTLAAFSAGGSIFVSDSDGMVLDGAGVDSIASRIGADGSTSAVTLPALAGVVAPNGDIALAAAGGAVAFNLASTSGAGRDLAITGDTFAVTAPLAGNGGTLLIAPATPALAIQLGGAAAAGTLHIGTDSLGNLAGGFDAVLIGSGVAGQDIHIDGRAVPVVVRDSLVLNVAGSGSLITFEGELTAEALEARGAAVVAGVVGIRAGNGAGVGGDMVFADSVNGATGNDHLTLAAGSDSVAFGGPVGAGTALASLTINDAANVSFTDVVTVKGDVIINATGVVRFEGPLSIETGSLIIRGATEVIIGDVIFHSPDGQFVVEANTLTLQGDVVGVQNAVLRPSDAGMDIVVGGSAPGAFNISAAMLQHLAGADSLVIGVRGSDGHAAAGAGNVTLAPLDFSAFTNAPVLVFGTSITLASGSGALTAASLVLDGSGGVTLQDSAQASAGDIVVYSASGAVTMEAGTTLSASKAVVMEAAGALGVGQVTAQNVVLRSTSGSIADVNGDMAVNVVADTLSLYGYGAVLGTGNPIEVQARAIYLAAPTGVELQDTGPDGRTQFYVLDGAVMYLQAVGIGEVARHTADPTPATVPSGASMAASAAFAAPVTSASLTPGAVERGTAVAGYLATLSTGKVIVSGALVAGAQGIGQDPAAVERDFDQWLQDLVLSL